MDVNFRDKEGLTTLKKKLKKIYKLHETLQNALCLRKRKGIMKMK